MSVKQFGSEMRPHSLCVLTWIQNVCKADPNGLQNMLLAEVLKQIQLTNTVPFKSSWIICKIHKNYIAT